MGLPVFAARNLHIFSPQALATNYLLNLFFMLAPCESPLVLYCIIAQLLTIYTWKICWISGCALFIFVLLILSNKIQSLLLILLDS
jgi:hypothetical protein